MIKYILFDIDGVIITSAGSFSRHFIRLQGLNEDAMQEFFSWAFRQCTTGNADLWEQISMYFEEWWWEWTVDEILDMWFTKDGKLDKEILALVAKLQGQWYRCILASNQERHRARYLLDTLDLRKTFDGYYISSDIWRMKPDRDFYEYIIADLWVPANEIIFIDDSEKNLVEPKNLWIHALFYNDYNSLVSELESFGI